MILSLLALLACADKAAGTGAPSAADSGATTSGATTASDTGATGGAGDTGSTGETGGGVADDTGDTGASLPLDGFGALAGDCGGEIDAPELTDAAPWLFANTLDFGKDGFDDGDYKWLSEGGQEVFDEGNLGGSSLYSEIFSCEVLYRCERAALLKTEGEISYLDAGGKKTDLLVSIDGYTVGVSVTRAYAWPPEDPYTTEQAQELLDKKLGDILASSANVAPEDAWTKQILHVIAYSPDHAAAVEAAFALVDAATKADTILLVTTTDGDDESLY